MATVLIIDSGKQLSSSLSIALMQSHSIATFTATDESTAIDHIENYLPDAICLYREEILESDGDFLKKLCEYSPSPILFIGSKTEAESSPYADLIESGDIILLEKPQGRSMTDLVESLVYQMTSYTPKVKNSASPARRNFPKYRSINKLFLIGVSTGGPQALVQVIEKLPKDFHNTLIIAQHLPEFYTEFLRQTLQQKTSLPILIPQHDDILRSSVIYLCTGGKHTHVIENDENIIFSLSQKGTSLYMPSIDILFSSIANIPHLAKNSTSFILTGMGNDGLKGCTDLSEYTSEIYIQNQESSVIFGMPKAIESAGLAKEALSLEKIALKIS